MGSAVPDAAAAALLAVLAAVGFAGSQVTLRRGLAETSVLGGLLVSLPTSLVILSVAVAFNVPATLDPAAMALFAVAGLAAPGIARWSAATGIERIGPSIAVPIMQGARPLLAVTGAVLLLGEPLGLHRGMGLAVIIVGGLSLSRQPHPDVATPLPRQLFRPGAAFPLLAGLAYASSDLFMKAGLGRSPYPAAAALTALATATAAWGALILVVPRMRQAVTLGGDVGWQALSGALAGLAAWSVASALRRGDVTLVSPIMATQPLAVFLWSRVLLRKAEQLRPSTVLGGLVVVVGTLILAVSR